MTTLTLSRIIRKNCDGFAVWKAEFSDGSRLIISERDADSLAARHGVTIETVRSW